MSGRTEINLEGGDKEKEGFLCAVCHQRHDLPLSYSYKAPPAVASIPEIELDQRVQFTLYQCVVDERDFYLRGRIPVPMIGRQEPFIWGVWAQVSPEDFLAINERWKMEGREADPPYRGVLHSPLPIYGDTLNLELRIHTQAVGRRPHFHIVDTAHPLGREQQEGMTMERAREIAEEVIHPRTERGGTGRR
jgi:hypothetical protein